MLGCVLYRALYGSDSIINNIVTSYISFIIHATLHQQKIRIMKLKTNCEDFL